MINHPHHVADEKKGKDLMHPAVEALLDEAVELVPSDQHDQEMRAIIRKADALAKERPDDVDLAYFIGRHIYELGEWSDDEEIKMEYAFLKSHALSCDKFPYFLIDLGFVYFDQKRIPEFRRMCEISMSAFQKLEADYFDPDQRNRAEDKLNLLAGWYLKSLFQDENEAELAKDIADAADQIRYLDEVAPPPIFLEACSLLPNRDEIRTVLRAKLPNYVTDWEKACRAAY